MKSEIKLLKLDEYEALKKCEIKMTKTVAKSFRELVGDKKTYPSGRLKIPLAVNISGQMKSLVGQESFINSSNVKLQMFDTNGAEGAARGAALGLGFYKSPHEAFKSLNIISEEKPNGKNDYIKRYKDWKDFLNKLN